MQHTVVNPQRNTIYDLSVTAIALQTAISGNLPILLTATTVLAVVVVVVMVPIMAGERVLLGRTPERRGDTAKGSPQLLAELGPAQTVQVKVDRTVGVHENIDRRPGQPQFGTPSGAGVLLQFFFHVVLDDVVHADRRRQEEEDDAERHQSDRHR